MSNSKKINNELSLISRYTGLKYSKYILMALISIIIIYYPTSITPLYIFLASFLTPILLGLIDSTQHNTKDVTEDFILLYTAKKRNFTKQKYKNEQYGCVVTILLLFIWQININRQNIYEMPLKTAPALLIIIYITTRIIISIFIKYKIKYNFMNLNI